MFVPEIPSQIPLGNGQLFLNEESFRLTEDEVVLDGEPHPLASATFRIHPDDYNRFVEEWLWLLADKAGANTDHSAAALVAPQAPRAWAFDYPSAEAAFTDVGPRAVVAGPAAARPFAMSFEYPLAAMDADPQAAARVRAPLDLGPGAGAPAAMAMDYPVAAASAAPAPAGPPPQGVSVTAVGDMAGVRRVIRFADVRSCRAFADDATIAVSLVFAHDGAGAGVAVLDAG